MADDDVSQLMVSEDHLTPYSVFADGAASAYSLRQSALRGQDDVQGSVFPHRNSLRFFPGVRKQLNIGTAGARFAYSRYRDE